MADATVVETYPMATNARADVEQIRQQHLADGATSSVITEDANNWVLTTVWPGGC